MKRLLVAFAIVALASPALPAAASPDEVGYMGCSVTWQAVDGYHTVGGDRMWEPIPDYGGGGVARMRKGTGVWWDALDDALSTHGDPAAFWFQICALTDLRGSYALVRQDTLAVLGFIHQRTTAPVQLSAQHCYDPGYGSNAGWQVARDVAEDLIAEGYATAGPVLPCLGAGELNGDKKHPNAAGRLVLGQALLDFYG